jgi:hypothetical protein
MRFQLEQDNRNASDEDLIADLRRVATLLGRDTVTIAEQNEHGRFHSTTHRRRFKGWKEALDLAGLQHGKRVNIPEEELLEHIEELWVRLGRQPHYSDLRGDGTFGGTTYTRRFGSWRKALEAFVAFVNSEDGMLERSAEETSVEYRPVKQGNRDINWRLRFIVMRRDNFKCKVCGRTPATDPSVTLDVDHIKAWSKCGPTILENLQTLCTKCNIGKSDLEFLNSSPIEVQNVEA